MFPATDLNPQKKVNKNSFWAITERNEPLDFYAHEGGGILGSIQYILANHDLVELQGLRNAQDHTANDGRFARVLANNVAKNFCAVPFL